MKNPFRIPRWSPYAVGALLGVLSWATFGLMGKALGVSTTFVRAAGAIEGTVAPDHVRENAYFAKYLIGKPAFEWQFALVVFLAIGAFLAARLARVRHRESVPQIWKARFGPARLPRFIGAFLGGVVLIIGARMAGGCTSGHGISGGLQLALSSFMFLGAMFGGGVLAAMLLYGRAGRTAEVSHV